MHTVAIMGGYGGQTTKIIYVEFNGMEHCVDVSPGRTLMEGARDNNVLGIDVECGGACSCSTCHAFIDPQFSSVLPNISLIEEDMLPLAVSYEQGHSRLTCQIFVTEEMDGLIVNLPESQS